MNIIKKIDVFLGEMGNLKAAERNHIDTFTEEKMEAIDGEKIATKSNGGIWIKHQELAGYNYLNALIIGENKIKTFNGSDLTFLSANNEAILKLTSDTREIKSEFSNISNRWITEISFDITGINIDTINNKTSSKIILETKKTREDFETLKLVQQP